MGTMKKYYEPGIFVVMFLPIIIFYWFVFIHTINVPYLDDFQILNTIVRVQNDPQKWWTILTENFNGHRFAEIKLLVWLDYLVEGQVNFKTLCIFGSLFLLGFWYFCLKILRENNIPIFYFIPFTFLLFQPIFHRNIFWMLSCLQYQQSIFFTIAAYYYLAKYTTKSFIISVILGVIHTQINGNAFYIFMLGSLIPLYQSRYKMTVIYLFINWFHYRRIILLKYANCCGFSGLFFSRFINVETKNYFRSSKWVLRRFNATIHL